MNSNALRVVLCGLIAGVVWHLLSSFSLALLAQDFAAFVERGGPYPRWGGGAFFAIDLLMGIWALWFYSVIAPRYGARPRAAAIAGIGWWSIKTLQSAKWVGIGLIPQGIVLVPLATTLIAAVAAAMTGAWIYEKVDSSRRSSHLT